MIHRQVCLKGVHRGAILHELLLSPPCCRYSGPTLNVQLSQHLHSFTVLSYSISEESGAQQSNASEKNWALRGLLQKVCLFTDGHFTPPRQSILALEIGLQSLHTICPTRRQNKWHRVAPPSVQLNTVKLGASAGNTAAVCGKWPKSSGFFLACDQKC